MKLKSFLKGQEPEPQLKLSILDVFRQKMPPTSLKKSELQFVNDYAEHLSKPIIQYKKIQKLSWNGIPPCIRPKIWKYLLKYCLLNDAQSILGRKRQEYNKYTKNYWYPQNFNEDEKKVYRTIDGDVKRIGNEYSKIFKHNIIQQTLKRILFIWHMRHPQSGYVQGMCDIGIPFLIVFIGQFIPINLEEMTLGADINILPQQTVIQIQADVYWCMSKMMQSVISNYTHGFGGLQQAYSKVQELLHKVDSQLSEHFIQQKIDLFAFSFRNISTMLFRLFSPKVSYRLLDTYISYQQGYPQLMIFLVIAVLQKFAKKMLKMKFDDIMSLIQCLPTKQWKQHEIQIIIAQAYVYMKMYGVQK